MQWTQEQQPIIHSTADKLLVQAFAGTGKTTTLVGYAFKIIKNQHKLVNSINFQVNSSTRRSDTSAFLP